MKTKPMMLPEPNPKRMAKLQSAPKPDGKQIDTIDFETIQNDYPENSIVSKTLMYVVSVSRLIDGNFGKYRICNIRDTKSQALTLSVYEPHVEKLQDDQVYSMTKVKKTIMKNDGQTRLSTTKFTQIQKGSQNEEQLFNMIQISDSVVEGSCVMYTNLSCYLACPKHWSKLDDDGECLGCKTKIKHEDAVQDFHCLLQIEDGEDIKSILIFRRHLKNKTKLEGTNIEECISELLIGKLLRVHYNNPTDDNIIAVKIDIIPGAEDKKIQ